MLRPQVDRTGVGRDEAWWRGPLPDAIPMALDDLEVAPEARRPPPPAALARRVVTAP